MPVHDSRALNALRALLRASHLASADDLPALVDAAAEELGAVGGVLYVIDYDQALLVPLLGSAGTAAEPIPVDGTLAGRTFSDVVQHVSAAGDRGSLWSPVLDGTERVGVLQLEFASDVAVDDELQRVCLDVAALVAELVMTKSLYGDGVERARRRSGMTVPAELQWTLLPPLTFVSPRVAIAGVLAPAAEVAGDSFDYALNGDLAHLAVFDAMGHGMEAALLAAVAVSTLRNARRGGLPLVDTVQAIDAEIAGQFGVDRFVTAIVGELEVTSGRWRWVTCGHPSALLVRNGRVVKVLADVTGPPLGLSLLDPHPGVGEERLEPGDRLVLYTDGVVEARDAEGTFFGTDRLVELVGRQAAAGRPVAETLRRLNRALLDHQEGALQDDATTVLVEWLSEEPELSTPS